MAVTDDASIDDQRSPAPDDVEDVAWDLEPLVEGRGAAGVDELIDRLLARATELTGARPALAFAYADEAMALAARSPVRHREAEATAIASRLAPPSTRSQR